jgi:predicted transcriptional regulator
MTAKLQVAGAICTNWICAFCISILQKLEAPMKVADALAAIIAERCRNNLEARRLKLRLSRAKLASMLGVDPASIYRHEREEHMSKLYGWALAGIEASVKKQTRKLKPRAAVKARPSVRDPSESERDRIKNIADRAEAASAERTRRQ